jgi:hypothetical protein
VDKKFLNIFVWGWMFESKGTLAIVIVLLFMYLPAIRKVEIVMN